MEFLEDNPNLEINLQSYEKNKKSNRKSFKSIRNNVNKLEQNYSISSLSKEQNQEIKDNFSIDKQNLNVINTPKNNENKETITDNSITQSPSKLNKSAELILKMKKTQKINNILDELKSKNNYHLSPNIDLKSYGELYPGPGQYYNPDIKIGQSQNFRYNNLFIKDTEPNITLKYKKIKDFYYNSKVGPGSYNPNDGIIFKSYSKNPNIFISQLERTPLFKINNTLGPGQYNLSTDYTKKMKYKYTKTNQFKKSKNEFNNSIGTQFTERDFQIFNTFNNMKNDNILNIKLNRNKDNINNNLDNSLDNSLNKSIDKSEGKKSRGTSGRNYNIGHRNFSWKGRPDFSKIGIRYNEDDNKNIIQNDNINYIKQNFNFENQYKLNQEKNKFLLDSSKRIKKELNDYNKLFMPLIQNVQRDLSLKGNHIPGPSYYKYVNNSIEGDMLKLSKRMKNNSYKEWK